MAKKTPKAPKKFRSGRIYLLWAEGTHFIIKIGFTSGPVSKRAKQITGNNPYRLRILGSRPGTTEDEQMMHGLFAPWCLRGEWFQVPEMMAILAYDWVGGEPVPSFQQKWAAFEERTRAS